MKCRKNIRKLIQEYNAAADKPNTALIKFRNALVALKAGPSLLPAPHTQANRYDDYVYIHQQSMAGHSNNDPGPHAGHKGPTFFPWHREVLRQFEKDLRDAANDQSICLPYWDWSVDKQSSDAGYPFIDDFLGGNGTGANNVVQTGVFAGVNGWVLNIDDNGSASLQRDFGGSGFPTLPAPGDVTGALAVNVFDSSPWNRNAAGPTSFRNLVEGWVNGPANHNRVHVWVGGSMLPSTSPNDPVFFLNHCKEDELWAVWMQKYPTVPHYLPLDSEPLSPGHTHLKRLSDHMEGLAEYFGALTIDRPIDLLNHQAITWYDTDLPDIVLESGPAVGFNQTPAGLTVARLIRFRIQTCRTLTFSITGQPTGNFSVVGGPDFTVVPVEANDFEIVEVEVRFHAIGANVQVSAVDIEARITDEEGYYAASPNDPFTVANFHIELVANNIVTSDSSVVLVLDRSGSMSDVANSGFTKSELLKSAVGVLHVLMQDNDEIGIARFDHEADVLLPMTLKTAGLGTTLTGTGLDPRGATSIGAGILVGSGLINGPDATNPNKAMLVLSDGNENTDPLITDLPAGTINQTTFAIGFGLPGQVSDPILSQISANTGGYLLVTGDMTDDDERFTLAKFFIQVLKDATLNQTVVDPQGLLVWGGAPHEIRFPVSEAEVSIDVVVLCPIPVALDFRLKTPSGQMITPAMSGVEPNVRYVMGQDVCYYRLMLPALPGNPAGSHRGTWTALLRLRKPSEIMADLRKMRDDKVNFAEIIRRLREFAEKAVPYNLTVHSYSNLTMDAALRQDGFAPGAAVHLTANLWEYQLPLRNTAQVWADVRQPNGTSATLTFLKTGPGVFTADWVTSRPGVYKFVVRAEGYTSGNTPFMREKVLTAGVWAGGDQPYHPKTDSEDDGGGCEWMLCLLEQVTESRVLQARLKELGIAVSGLRSCLEKHCRRRSLRMPKERIDISTSAEWRRLQQLPEFQRFAAVLTSAGMADLPVLAAEKTTPVVRKPKLPSTAENMFVLPEQAEQMCKGKKKKG
ncbi:MAG: tyrosinase family protein [Verrucomicrobia bacterium]|nr:tyrosinase family protein [Deltaproteobacteria bacterium]